jgi:hypothetical protein
MSKEPSSCPQHGDYLGGSCPECAALEAIRRRIEEEAKKK